MLETINSITAPVGARLLVKDDRYLAPLCEVRVLEWSPSQRAVKLHYEQGLKVWKMDLPLLVETLPQPLSPAKQAAIERGLGLVDGLETLTPESAERVLEMAAELGKEGEG